MKIRYIGPLSAVKTRQGLTLERGKVVDVPLSCQEDAKRLLKERPGDFDTGSRGPRKGERGTGE